MLTCNLWTLKGLVNGAQGVVKKIWFDQGSNYCSHLPAVVFVEFDGYSGPKTPACISPSWVPIIPAVARWETKAGNALTHTQLPLMIRAGHRQLCMVSIRCCVTKMVLLECEKVGRFQF